MAWLLLLVGLLAFSFVLTHRESVLEAQHRQQLDQHLEQHQATLDELHAEHAQHVTHWREKAKRAESSLRQEHSQVQLLMEISDLRAKLESAENDRNRAIQAQRVAYELQEACEQRLQSLEAALQDSKISTESTGQDTPCATGWAGDNCDVCAEGWTGEECDQLL